jgi:hypothetical protein
LRQAYDYWQNQPGNYLRRPRPRPRRHPAGAGQSSSLTGGRGPRPPGSLERCYNRALAAIRLPPLSFPKDRPPHAARAPERHHRVRFGPLRGRIPSAGPRPARDGSLLGLASDCLGRVVPGGQPSTDSNRACHAEAGESSGASAAPPGGRAGFAAGHCLRWRRRSWGAPAGCQRPVSGHAALRRRVPSRWEAPPREGAPAAVRGLGSRG